MSGQKKINLLKVAKEFGIGIGTIVEFLDSKGEKIPSNPMHVLSPEQYSLLLSEYQSDKKAHEQAQQIEIGKYKQVIQKELEAEKVAEVAVPTPPPEEKPEVVEAVAQEKPKKEKPVKEAEPAQKEKVEEVEKINLTSPKLKGLSAVGKLDLSEIEGRKKPKAKAKEEKEKVAEEKVVSPPSQETKVVEEKPIPKKETKAPAPPEVIEVVRAKSEKLKGLTELGKMELPVFERKKKEPATKYTGKDSDIGDNNDDLNKKKRKRIQKDKVVDVEFEKQKIESKILRERNFKGKRGRDEMLFKKEIFSQEDVQDQIKKTKAKLNESRISRFADRAKFRKQKRDDKAFAQEQESIESERGAKTIKVTEFITVQELSQMTDIPINELIGTCMSLGMMVSINQRLDTELIKIVAEEFDFEVELTGIDEDIEDDAEIEDKPEDLQTRPSIITVMGHVDHGKTSLLDYIRESSVVSGEVGGITQHVGAYEVELPDGRMITFLDTPGHEAFTAMRARGAKLTDIAVIVISADDAVMPQTKEAISHAQASNVPIVFAFTKIDKPGANTDKIKEQLAEMNLLVEDWGGKYQSQGISSKTGEGIEELMEKILVEAELLELKGNPKRLAQGTVIEAYMDKGRGIMCKLLVQNGTLKVGDIVLAGCFYGKVKALFNERMQNINEAGLSSPALMLGINGTPRSGDLFKVIENESKAKEIATKKQQLIREQGERTQRHITLDEVGRRISVGNFKELNLILKGDVDGSVEALSDSFMKLHNEQIQVKVLAKNVGQITDSDVMLASATGSIIIGFQVRPSISARKLAEKEGIEIRTYSIIYDAINDLEDAINGMLAPTFEEKIMGNIEIRETFKISKIGTIAGCMVLDGKVFKHSNIRLIRDGVVIYTGKLASLKRFKDDVKEVVSGYECGLNIEGYNDIKVGDIVEAFEDVEVKPQAVKK